jgi:hypothetical protein
MFNCGYLVGVCGYFRSMTDINDLERQLASALERRQQAIAALAPKHKGGEWQTYHAANQEVLRLERQLAAANGEQYAEPCGFPLSWDGGTPMPHLMVNDLKALLAFRLSDPGPVCEASHVANKGDDRPRPLGLVEFDFCVSARLGTPNDEVFDGHPLNGKGLEAFGAQRVVNSHWLEELEAINRVHLQYRPESWREQTHFIFWFHDSTFECVARSYKTQTHHTSMRALLGLMADRLMPG